MNRRKTRIRSLHSVWWTLAVGAAVTAYLLLAALPQAGRMKALSRGVSRQQAELAARAESLDALARANREVGALAERVADFNVRIPEQPLLGSFLEELARVAQDHKLQSDAIQPGEPVRSHEVVALPITLKVRGPFSAVHDLVRDIEQMPRLTRFEQFKVSADTERPGTVKADLSLKVFYGPLPQGAKAG